MVDCVWRSDLIDEACRQLEEAGFNDDEHGDLGAACDQVLYESGTLRAGRRARLPNDPDKLATTVSMGLVRECVRRANEAVEAHLALVDRLERNKQNS